MKLTRTLLLLAALGGALNAQTHWIATWGAAPSPQGEPSLKFSDQTLREIVHVSLGGDTIRVRLANTFGTTGVKIGAAHVALREKDSSIAAASDRPLTFSGNPSIEIPAGAVVISDPVKLTLPAAADLAVSLYVPGDVTGGGIHFSALQTSWSVPGDATAAASLTSPKKITSWVFLTGVDVLAPESAATVVAFGDSITDGARSTVDGNYRWPNVLASRLLARRNGSKLAVVNMGIGGNRVLHDGAGNNSPHSGISALARFNDDVLAVPGVRYLLVLEGINDIGHNGPEVVTADDIIAGLKQLIERAHEKGIKVIGATLTPFEGPSQAARGYYKPEKEGIRAAVNNWIRTSHDYDGVVDFDKVIRDPQNPNHMLAAYDSGDQLHPGDAGYKAMGEAIDLNLFNGSPKPSVSAR